MSVWTTKSSGKDREFIVIQHKLKNVDYTIQGIKFRAGYAVVEKNSKAYYMLKKMPILKEAKEYPLIHLRSLPFITRTNDVKTVFGQEVYVHYLKQLTEVVEKEKEQREEKELVDRVEVRNRCSCVTKHGALCENEALEASPSGYCKIHILEDPRLSEFGITIPRLTREERLKFKEKVISILAKAKRDGKF